MIKDKTDFKNELDLLNGNINRLCVTDDIHELDQMVIWANRRLLALHKYRKKQLEQ